MKFRERWFRFCKVGQVFVSKHTSVADACFRIRRTGISFDVGQQMEVLGTVKLIDNFRYDIILHVHYIFHQLDLQAQQSLIEGVQAIEEEEHRQG